MMTIDVNSIQKVYEVKDIFGHVLYYQGKAWDGSFIDYIPCDAKVTNKVAGQVVLFKNVSIEQARNGTKKAKVMLADGKTIIIDENENLLEEVRQFISNPSFRLQCIRNIDSKKIDLLTYIVSSFSKFSNVPVEEIPQYQSFQNFVNSIFFVCGGTRFCDRVGEMYSLEQKERLVGRVIDASKQNSILDKLKAIGGKIGPRNDGPSTGLKM